MMNNKALKITLKVFQWTLFSIVAFLFIASAYMLFSKLVLKKKVPMIFGYSFVSVEGWSMQNEALPEDNLYKGDIVVIKKLADDEYKVGMTVTFDDGGNLPTTHKITKKDGNLITTQGISAEGNTSEDAPIDVSQIIGAKVGVIRKLGSFIDFVKSPMGIVIFILVGFLIIETPSIVSSIAMTINEKKLKKVGESPTTENNDNEEEPKE